ncbi:MAG TPA: hypothetical protein VEZ90_07420 [Blastocatellia bacterium]|nr:hypothetical protein [Blastocatellia bacterium]
MADNQAVRALAEQAYLFYLLVKTLRERGLLQPGEPAARWNQAEFQEFLDDFRAKYFSEES